MKTTISPRILRARTIRHALLRLDREIDSFVLSLADQIARGDSSIAEITSAFQRTRDDFWQAQDSWNSALKKLEAR